ncbi:MAG: hypothetical protein AAFO04_19320 [Cyanobacteria bacterium J06592_8]
MRKISFRLISGIGFILILFTTYYYYGRSDVLNFSTGANLIPAVLAATSMFIGIIFGCLFRQLKGKNESISIVKEISQIFSSASFWSAIAVSPLVFFCIFAVSGDNPEGFSNYALAFQNGFLCESIFRDMFPQTQL